MSILAGHPVHAPVRTKVEDFIAGRGSLDLSHLNANLPEMDTVHENVEFRVRGDAKLTGEVYVPLGAGQLPLFLYLHGGGWSGGCARDERKIAMRIASAGFIVLNLDYRLAPEHPFPSALEDCIFAAQWLVNNAQDYGGRRGPIGIGGHSAGANLSASTVAALSPGGEELLARLERREDEQSVSFYGAVLFAGIYSFPLMLQEPGANAGVVELWHQSYLGPNYLRENRNPLVSPAFAPNLKSFPPTYVCCGSEDACLSQSLCFTKALAEADVSVTASVVAGVDHGLPFLDHVYESVEHELASVTAWLDEQCRVATSDPL